MEMADYERLVKELHTKLSEREEYAEELKTQINTLSQKEETLKQEIGMDFMFLFTLTHRIVHNNAAWTSGFSPLLQVLMKWDFD